MNKSTVELLGSEAVFSRKSLPVFDDRVVSYLTEVGREVMSDASARQYPDVTTFGFYLRKANLCRLKEVYQGEESRIGRGLSFHIAPSNVPVNFAYSMLSAMLSGCPSIVKVSGKDFPQVRLLCGVFAKVLERYPDLKDYLYIVMYPREDTEQTHQYSERCAVRVIWGGDETVLRVREIPLPPRSIDISFADRYSLAILKSEAVLSLEPDKLSALAADFYNDTYLTDQNACNSPRMLYWVGEEEQTASAQERFWHAVSETVKKKNYQFAPLTAVDKLTAAVSAMVDVSAQMLPGEDNLVVRLALPQLKEEITSCRAPGGFFPEYCSRDLSELSRIVTTRYQTLAQFGFDNGELRKWVVENRLPGIDRVCRIGATMEFSLNWDGYDLIRTFSRVIG